MILFQCPQWIIGKSCVNTTDRIESWNMSHKILTETKPL